MRQTDLKAYEELYKKYYNLVYNIAFSVLKNYENAEDIAQNVFVKIGNLEQKNCQKIMKQVGYIQLQKMNVSHLLEKIKKLAQ